MNRTSKTGKDINPPEVRQMTLDEILDLIKQDWLKGHEKEKVKA